MNGKFKKKKVIFQLNDTPKNEFVLEKLVNLIIETAKELSKVRQHQNNGYVLQKVEVENIVVWKEFKQVLCKIYFVK